MIQYYLYKEKITFCELTYLKLNAIYNYIIILNYINYFQIVALHSENNKLICQTIALGSVTFTLQF